MNNIYFPAEWHKQTAVQLTWPHKETDWADMMDEVLPCFVEIAKSVLRFQHLVIVCKNKEEVLDVLGRDHENLIIKELPSDDTWARDHGGISVFVNEQPVLLDFQFNGWGEKFDAGNDNQITSLLYKKGLFAENVIYQDMTSFVLEGGSIESDGKGTLLTTSQCLLAEHRNQPMNRKEIEDFLIRSLGMKKVLWLENGYLAGDDTDGHIDMLARFCDEKTIAYVKAPDYDDEHREALELMEKELKEFTDVEGNKYNLMPLPMADPVYHEGERLPASYANFLIINGAVLIPVYGTAKDKTAIEQFAKIFPDRELIPVNCLPLIKQHGSLHCLTMQYPEGFII